MSNFVWFSFRGKVRFLRKDTAESCPYLCALVNSPSQNMEKDKDGNIMIDEDYKDVINCIKIYQVYLETGKVPYLLLSSTVASRLGFDQEFVLKMREKPESDYKKRELKEAAKNTRKIHKFFTDPPDSKKSKIKE